ncbi:sialic acid-binding Ig-like lectin 13 isoform X3 [Paroedura picta]|uniref:sialic acid-binding Ig-like lectin 13 isoform X3 n=1 Tax=Paroedura picta TaxID=143630 RepID=UPI0040575688
MLGKRQHQQSMYPPWKVMNPASFSATLIVLIFAVPYKGLQGQNPDYSLTVPDSVSVQRGLCVHIPCSFTYKQRDWPSPRKLYGYWFQKKDRYWHDFTHEPSRHIPGILVATNDKRQELRASVSTRFQLTGEPEEGDCSFSILDARSEDAGGYYFRIEDDPLRWSYKAGRPQVLVTELEGPQIWASSAVLSGKEALYACLAPGPCVEIQAWISWTTSLRGYETTDWNQQHMNRSWTYGSNFTFTPSLNDQGRELTCRVWYPNIQEQVTKSIRLEVADPPKAVEISTNATDREHLAWCSGEAGGGLESAVVREGESISLHCHATSRPHPALSWRKENETLQSTGQGEPCVLLLSSVGKEDAGEYQCWAETAHGSANRTLRLCVLWSHGSLAISGLCGALAAVLLCVLCLGLIKFYKQRKAKASSKADGVEVLNSANGGHQRASEGSLIYSNIPPLGNKLPRSNQPQAVRERIPAPSLRIPSGSIPDPEELNYANVEFSKLKARKPTPMEESVEYTEVKQK